MRAEPIFIALDEGAASLLDRLHAAGHAAYAVGGCVRDSLLGLVPHDWDLCTSATPAEVLALFGEEHCIPTGLQHGTVTIKSHGNLYETTTFRTEGAYSDGRHPDAVHFVPDVKEDLARRDFTINAMAYSAEEGLIDPFGGRADLAAGIVRAEHFPVRLAALLCPLGEAGARAPLKRLKVSNALAENVTVLVRECPKLLPQTRIGPFHCPPYCLRQQGPTHRTVFGKTSDTPAEESVQIQTKRILGRYDLHTVEQMDALCGAICPEKAADFAAQAALARQLEAESVCCRVNQLAVNGRDLMAAGVAPGPGLRRVLEGLLEQVITGRLPNEKAALLAAAAQFSAS